MPSASYVGSEVGETVTTAAQFDLSGDDNKLDCLLHGEHHVFDTDCWDTMVSYYRKVQAIFPNEPHRSLMDRYCLAYESKVMYQMTRG